ncbi:hypothetical protein [Pendulispora albinea]|uniref:Uncharacterized protein n=1 Tax=Pendulispora albinea TaxID=2741071 RepID=A0ABZ2LWB6_9BACT
MQPSSPPLSSFAPLEAFERVVRSERLEQQLAATVAKLAELPELADEAAWLEVARQRIARARGELGDLLTRVLRLPELEPLRGERGRTLQDAALDAAERLHKVIRKAAGGRSPVIDVLYMNMDLVLLRRAAREPFEAFCAEIDRRLASSYLKRMLADETYLPVAPALTVLRRAFDEWRTVFASAPLEDAEAEALQNELFAVAQRLDLPCRQAMLLADAALLPAEHLREPSGIFDKPRKRSPASKST